MDALPSEQKANTQINVVPMAGKGTRYKKGFYNISKPLVLIGSEPMFLKASNSFPSSDQWFFLFRADNLKKHPGLKALVRDNFRNSKIIEVITPLHSRGIRIRSQLAFYNDWLGKVPVRELGETALLFDVREIHHVGYFL